MVLFSKTESQVWRLTKKQTMQWLCTTRCSDSKSKIQTILLNYKKKLTFSGLSFVLMWEFWKLIYSEYSLRIGAAWSAGAIWLRGHWKQINNPGQQDPLLPAAFPLQLDWGHRGLYIQRFNWETDKITVDVFFICPKQLNRWPCHSLTGSLTHGTFTYDIQRATMETRDQSRHDLTKK